MPTSEVRPSAWDSGVRERRYGTMRTTAGSLQRVYSVSRKELFHILRDPATLFFSLFIPIVEMFMLGYAINTNVRHVRTVIVDQCRTQESRALLRQFENSEDFLVIGQVQTDEELTRAI